MEKGEWRKMKGGKERQRENERSYESCNKALASLT